MLELKDDIDNSKKYNRQEIRWYEWIYEIDTNWVIYSYRKRRQNEWVKLSPKERVLKPRIKLYPSGREVLCVTLYHISHRKYHYQVSKLVYGMFHNKSLKSRNDEAVLYHIDGNIFNNTLNNLKERTLSAAKTKGWG